MVIYQVFDWFFYLLLRDNLARILSVPSNLDFLCSRSARGFFSRDFSSLSCYGPLAWILEKGKRNFIQYSIIGFLHSLFFPFLLYVGETYSSTASWQWVHIISDQFMSLLKVSEIFVIFICLYYSRYSP